MQFYHFKNKPDFFQSFFFAGDDHFDSIYKLFRRTASIHERWKSPIIKISDPRRKKPALSMLETVFPVFSVRAWDVLSPLIGDDAEALPLRRPVGDEFVVIHVLRELNCLNVAKSKISGTAKETNSKGSGVFDCFA